MPLDLSNNIRQTIRHELLYPQHGTTQHMANSPPIKGRMFGYARVSTADQKLDMQIEALERIGVAREDIYVETVSGASRRRPALEKCLKALRRGDTLYVWKVDRLGRKTLQVLSRLDDFRQRGIEFRSLTEALDFTTPIGEAMIAISAAFAQYERRLTSERTAKGIATHKAQGKPYGRKVEFDLKAALTHLRKHRNVAAAAKHVKVTRQTLWYHVQKDPKLMALLTRRKR